MSKIYMADNAANLAPTAVEPKQFMICMSIPLLTRVFELVREDVTSDENLHFILEKIIELSIEEGELVMEDYEDIVKANPPKVAAK